MSDEGRARFTLNQWIFQRWQFGSFSRSEEREQRERGKIENPKKMNKNWNFIDEASQRIGTVQDFSFHALKRKLHFHFNHAKSVTCHQTLDILQATISLANLLSTRKQWIFIRKWALFPNHVKCDAMTRILHSISPIRPHLGVVRQRSVWRISKSLVIS